VHKREKKRNKARENKKTIKDLKEWIAYYG
jgi:hypothetical protein